jgi:ABC-2 type transport system ATP-binding protein
MGEKKAIIFSTHILEEVEAVCSRAIIIDRGQIVANGTPQELKGRSDLAGAVSLRVNGIGSDVVKQKLGQIPLSKKVIIVKEASQNVLARVFPKPESVNGELARSVAELAVKENWRFEELHTEEGRLDEVFRNITMPDTAEVVK